MLRRTTALPLALLLSVPLSLAVAAPAAAVEGPTYLGYLVDAGEEPALVVTDEATGEPVGEPVPAYAATLAVVDGAPVVARVALDDEGRDVVVLRADGADRVLWTAPTVEASADELDLSADGSRLVFTVEDGDLSSVVLVDVRAGSSRTLTGSTSVFFAGPSFGPDGVLLSWAEVSAAGSRVVLARADGGPSRQLVSSGAQVLHTDTAWSPDGSTLAVVRHVPAGPETSSIELVDVRTGTERVIARGWLDETSYTEYGEPVWDPDGSAVYASRETSSDTAAAFDLVRIPTEVGSFPDVVAAPGYAGGVTAAAAPPPPDVTAPGPVTDLTATSGAPTSTLSWALPADADVAEVVVTRSEGAPATTLDESQVVARSSSTSVALALPAPDTDYGLSVFVRDLSGNVSPAAATTVRSGPPSVLSLSAPPSRVTYRTAVRLTGRLLAGGAPLAGQEVLLYARRAYTSTPQLVGVARTVADGTWAASYAPPWTAELQARYVGFAGYAAASAKRVVQVAPVVSLSLSASRTVVGRAVTLAGGVAPSHAGAVVEVQRKVGTGWRTIASTRLSSTSTYRYALKPGTRGTWTLRVIKRADNDHVLALSPARALTVG